MITVLQHAGVPGGLIGGPRAYQDLFRGFKYHRVHARRGFLLHNKLVGGRHESTRGLTRRHGAWIAFEESPHGRGYTFWAKGFKRTEFPK